MRTFALAAIAALTLAATDVTAGGIRSSVEAGTLAEKKTTPLGLYLTPADAHAALQADPAIVFIDVRDPIEISFVGHPQGLDANIPVRLATHSFNPASGSYKWQENPAFIAEIDAVLARQGLGKDTPVFLICRSGGRSATAARRLIESGYSNVWNLVEGFEGDKDRASGIRSLNGWRNAGLPWSYKIPAAAAWQPSE